MLNRYRPSFNLGTWAKPHINTSPDKLVKLMTHKFRPDLIIMITRYYKLRE